MSQEFLSWSDILKITVFVGGFIFGGAILIGLAINSLDPNNENVKFISIISSIIWMTVSPFTSKKLNDFLFTKGESGQ